MVRFARVPLIGIVVAFCATWALATVERSVTYESRDLVYGPNISYWNYVTSENGLCGNGYSESTSATFGSVSLQFTGIAVSLDMVRSVNGTKVAIDLDGSRVDEIDTYLDTVDCTTPVFQRSGLDYGKHTIVLSDLSDLPRQMRFEGFRYTTYTEEEIATMAVNSTSATSTHTKDGRKLHIGIIALLAIIALFVILGFILGCIWFFRRRRPTNSEQETPTEMGPGGTAPNDSLIHAMQQKIDSLSASVEGMNAQLADATIIKDEVTALGRRVRDIEGKTDGLGSSVGYTRNSISEFGESLYDTRQRLSGLDYRVPALETNLAALELSLAAVQNKPLMAESPSKSDLQQLSDRLDNSLSAVQNQLRDHTTTTHDRITRLDNNVSAIEAKIIGMEFDTHKDHLSSAQKAIVKLETTANENQAGLANLNDLSQGRLTDLERRVAETQEELTRTRQSVEDKHMEVQAAQVTIAELEARMNQADQEVSNLQQVSDSTQQKVAVIEQSLGETREGLPRIIENTFRDSQVIRSTMESSMEKQCTTIVDAMQDQLRNHATTTHDHITRLDNDVSTINAQIIGMDFNTHKDGLSSAQIAIARLQTTANENQAGLARLDESSQGRLTDLERRVAETQEGLGRTKQSVEDNHTEVQAARFMIGELETRMSQANREMSSLQQASNSTLQQVDVIEKSLDKTWEDLPRIIENTFRDSQDIQSTMESRVETQCTTIIDSTLESNVTPRILVVETKADIMEKQLDSVQQDGATKKEVLSTQASLDNVVSAIRAELEKATRGLDDKVREIEVKLDNLEASLPELQHTITNTITNTVRESKEIHETIENTIHRSEVIREVITKTASLSNQMASVGTLRADLRDLNTLTEDMRNRVIRLEEMLVTGDTPSDHSDAGGERLAVPEDRFQARATLVVQLQTRVTRVERRIAQIIGESTKTRRDLDMVQQIAVGLRAARGRG